MTTETSLRVRPMPLSRMPPRAVSVTASSTSSCASTRPAPLGPGVVARLDELAVDVDAVGVRPADEPAVGAGDVGDHPRGRGLAVGAGDGDDRDPRGDRARAWPRRRRRRPAPRPRSPPASTSAPGRASSTSATARPITWARSRCTPRERDDDLVRVAGGPHPDGEPRRTGLGRDRPHQPRHRPHREPLPEPGVRRRPAGRSCSPIRRANRAAVSSEAGGQRADVEGQLDRRPGEVEVRSFEDPELDEGGGHAGTLACVGVGELRGRLGEDRLRRPDRRRPGGARLGDPPGPAVRRLVPARWAGRGPDRAAGTAGGLPRLRETSRPDVDDRTTFNVRDSDATLLVILPGTEPSGGTAFTPRRGGPARAAGTCSPTARTSPSSRRGWTACRPATTLNVAGPRESKAPGIYLAVTKLLDALDA